MGCMPRGLGANCTPPFKVHWRMKPARRKEEILTSWACLEPVVGKPQASVTCANEVSSYRLFLKLV